MPTEAGRGTGTSTTCRGTEDPVPPLLPGRVGGQRKQGWLRPGASSAVLEMSGPRRKALARPRTRRPHIEGQETASRHQCQGDSEATMSWPRVPSGLQKTRPKETTDNEHPTDKEAHQPGNRGCRETQVPFPTATCRR